MQHVSRELSAEMVKKGWVKETCSHWVPCGGEWALIIDGSSVYRGTIPAMTRDEILEEVSLEDFMLQFGRENPEFHPGEAHWQRRRLEWIYTTMRSADAAARVWLTMREGK